MIAAKAFDTEVSQQSVRSSRSNTTILLVDDDELVLRALRAVLVREGYIVIAAASPTLALEIATERTFDMLITDYDMPGLDGFTLASRLAKGRLALPVLLISGSEQSALPIFEVAERNWNFMAKPIDRERLLRIVDGECLGWALRKHASRHRASQEN